MRSAESSVELTNFKGPRTDPCGSLRYNPSCMGRTDVLSHGTSTFVCWGTTSTSRELYKLYSTIEILTTRNGPAVMDAKGRYWSKIAIFAPVRGPSRNIARTFGMEKLEWRGYPTVKIIFIRDRQTDTARRHRHTARLCIASRGKKTTSSLADINKVHWCLAIIVSVAASPMVNLITPRTNGRNSWQHSTLQLSSQSQILVENRYFCSIWRGIPVGILL